MPRSRRTSPKAGKAASKVLRDGRSGKASKTAAGSALSQRAPPTEEQTMTTRRITRTQTRHVRVRRPNGSTRRVPVRIKTTVRVTRRPQ